MFSPIKNEEPSLPNEKKLDVSDATKTEKQPFKLGIKGDQIRGKTKREEVLPSENGKKGQNLERESQRSSE